MPANTDIVKANLVQSIFIYLIPSIAAAIIIIVFLIGLIPKESQSAITINYVMSIRTNGFSALKIRSRNLFLTRMSSTRWLSIASSISNTIAFHENNFAHFIIPLYR
jgi:hypothetical protein